MNPIDIQDDIRNLEELGLQFHGNPLFAPAHGFVSEEELRAQKWRWFEISAARRAHTSRGDYLMNCAVERRKMAAARGWRWEHEIKQATRCEHAAREHYQRAADIRALRRTQNE